MGKISVWIKSKGSTNGLFPDYLPSFHMHENYFQEFLLHDFSKGGGIAHNNFVIMFCNFCIKMEVLLLFHIFFLALPQGGHHIRFFIQPFPICHDIWPWLTAASLTWTGNSSGLVSSIVCSKQSWSLTFALPTYFQNQGGECRDLGAGFASELATKIHWSLWVFFHIVQYHSVSSIRQWMCIFPNF